MKVHLQFSTLIKLNALSFTCLFLILTFSLLSTVPLTEKRVVIQTVNGAGISTQGRETLIFQGPANAGDQVKIILSFPPRNRTALAKKIMAATIPGSKLFGQHPTQEEVNALVAPDPQAMETIHSWLKNNGIPSSASTSTRNHVQLSLTVRQANVLLRTNIGVFNNPQTGESSINAQNVSVSSSLASLVINVKMGFGASRSFNGMKSPTINGSVHSPIEGCSNSTITPACLQTLYEIPANPTSHPDNSIALSGFQPPSDNDIDAFLTEFRPDLTSSSSQFTLFNIDGGANSQFNSTADSDLEYIMALAPGTNTSFYVLNSNTLDRFTDFVQLLLDSDDPPKVVSTSYGFNEVDVPRETAEMLCDELMQLTARGTTLLFSTGDGGVAGAEAEQCSSFQVTFPASCPWVTAVGSTSRVPEIAADFSNGGFSNYFSMPSYQQFAVRDYLHDIGTTHKGLFNPNGRGVPDISAEGVNLPSVVGGELQISSGTSFSVPIVAAIVANLNGALLAAGKSPIGFLNPTIYFEPGVTNDITTGFNPGCETSGFSTAVGWDPVTGLGTPNASALFSALSP